MYKVIQLCVACFYINECETLIIKPLFILLAYT
jgi:hypothetical protein